MGNLKARALLLGVYVGAPDSRKLSSLPSSLGNWWMPLGRDTAQAEEPPRLWTCDAQWLRTLHISSSFAGHGGKSLRSLS